MEWLSKLLGREMSTFMKFSIIGAVWTVINIGLDVYFVDYLGWSGWSGTLIGYVILYIGRYYSYLLWNVIQPKFWKYVYSTAIFTAVMWGMKIVAIDYLDISASIGSPVITLLAFVLKYFFYKAINLLQTPESK
jgi:putative flippase GtrA